MAHVLHNLDAFKVVDGQARKSDDVEGRGGNSLTLVKIRNATRDGPGIQAATASAHATQTHPAPECTTSIY